MRDTKGVTLIELVIFIIIGGLFVPLAYIAFTSVARDSIKPETTIKTRFIAEAKMEEITKEAYDSIALASPAYTAVNADSRFADSSYNGYQWKWEITDILFQDNTGTTPYTTTIASAPQNTWAANTTYSLGAYVKPTTPNNHFYRVYFPKWQANTAYRNGNNIIPTTSNGHVYRLALNYPTWQANTPYTPTSNVFPTTYNEFFYRVVAPPTWSSLTFYGPNDIIVSSDQNFIYQLLSCLNICLTGFSEPFWGAPSVFDGWAPWWGITWSRIQLQSGPTQPTWPIIDNQTVIDNNITWRSYTMRSGNSEPAWQTGVEPLPLTADRNLLWLADTSMKSSLTTEPTWPVTAGGLVDDNSLKWVESNVYKLVKVYVRPPDCSSDTCTYIATSVVTGRNYTTRP